MPNWCYNTIQITGDTEKIDSFEKFLTENEGKDWFDFFAPCPEELTKQEANFQADSPEKQALLEKYGYTDWYGWCIDNWGTKWNSNAIDWSREDDTISFTFDTAWGPPIALFDEIQAQGYFVQAKYLEEGMQFTGQYDDGVDETYEYSDLESLDDIPEELVEHWNLREQMEDRIDWDSEDEIEFSDVPVEFIEQEDRDWLIDKLRNEDNVIVTFQKVDGTERKMFCTLSESKIPKDQAPKGSGKAQSSESLAVFDLEKSGWRSFRWDSIIDVEYGA